MPLLKRGVPIPVLGIDFSKPATFIDPRSGFPQNMRYWRSEMRKRAGKAIVGSKVPDNTQIMGLGQLQLNSGIKYSVRNSKTIMERFNTSLLDWESISNTPFSGGNDDFFSYATVTESGLLIITNFVDAIRKWNGSGNAAILGGSPGKAKYVAYLSPYLLLAYVDEGSGFNPWKVKWCDTDAPETWIGGNSGSELLSSEPSPIQNIKKFREFMVVYKRDSIWLSDKKDPPTIFNFEPVETSGGLAAPRALAEANSLHFLMGENDFYVFNGIRRESIGGPIRDVVFDLINRDKINRCFAEHVQSENEIWFYIVNSGYDWPTNVWKFSYLTGNWFYDTCTELTSALKWERISSQSWDNTPGTWDQQEGAWDSGVRVTDWEEVLVGRSDGYVGKIDFTTTNDFGAAVDAIFATKDFTGENLEENQRWLQLDFWARGVGKISVDYSIDEGNTWINIPYQSSQAFVDADGIYRKYELYLDVVSDKIRFRFRNNFVNETFFVRNFMPYYLSQDEIRRYRS